jgi:PAS domain S-box-containing protein
MSFRISITSKGVALVLAPLAVELILIGFLFDSSRRAEAEAKQAEHMRDVSDTTNALVKELYHTVGGINLKDLEKTGDYAGLAADEELAITQLMERLDRLTAGNAVEHAPVVQSQKAFHEAVAELHSFGEAVRRGDSETSTRIRKNMKYLVRAMISRELIDVNKQAADLQNEAREREQKYREQVRLALVALTGGSILVSLIALFGLTQGITRRLSRLGDNALKIGRNEALPPPMPEQDEIADVDRAFHAMAYALEQSAHRERAVLENARDMICSIDATGRITAMNQACRAALDYEPEDLLGRYYIDLVPKDDASAVLKAVDAACEEGRSRQFEARMLTKSGRVVEFEWSTQWSTREKALFCVLHDISERKEVERLRQEIVAMVTHDLRTPLTAIRHIIEMMRTGVAGDLSEDGSKMLGRADVASTRMMLLINDLLDIEKIKAGMMQLKLSKILSCELFELSSQTLAGLLAEKSIELVSDGSEIEVLVDPDRIVQVLVNLVSNAIKFSSAGARIELSARIDGSAVEFSVRDHGRGIPPEMLDSIFDRFQQVQDSDSRQKGGSGLGLSICRALVELHAGRIWAENSPGQGSTFKFVVPKA